MGRHIGVLLPSIDFIASFADVLAVEGFHPISSLSDVLLFLQQSKIQTLQRKEEPFSQICPVAYPSSIAQTGYPFIITHQNHHPQPPSIPNSPFFNTLTPPFHIRPSIRIVLNSRTAPATARIGALVKTLKARPAAAEAATEPSPKGDRLWLLPPLLDDNDAGRRR